MFSVFSRLYVGLVTGLALTIGLFLLWGEYMRKTEVSVFSTMVLTLLINTLNNEVRRTLSTKVNGKRKARFLHL